MEEQPLNPKAQKMEEGPSMAELPNVILIDIISRLPIKTIMQCKLLCKSFDYVISRDPELYILHLSRSTPELILCTPDLEKLLIVDSDTDGAHELNLRLEDMELINSCRGLLCLRPRYVVEPIRILNPVTLEFIVIPKPVIPVIEGGNTAAMLVGLGYSTVTNEYKVLMFIMNVHSNGEKYFSTIIYTLGTPSWRTIPSCPMLEFNEFFSATLNGSNLHWVMNEYNAEYMYDSMSYFNFNTEMFSETKLPPPFRLSDSTDRESVRVLSLSVFQGFLTLSLLDEDRSIHVWMMTNSRRRQRWSLNMVIDTIPFFVPPEHIKYSFPVKFMTINNEPTLIYIVDNVLMTNDMRSIGNNCWMTRNERVKKHIFSTENILLRAFMHDPILVPLNELVRGVRIHYVKPTGRKVWRRVDDEWIISPVEERT